MSPRVQSLYDEPLAGCQPIFEDAANATNMLRSLLMRLRIYYTEKVCTALGDRIIAEAGNVQIYRMEYVINEVQYEIRRAGNYNPAFEEVLLNSWVKDLLNRVPEDAVWQFNKVVRGYREERKR
jgi:hypothetical protein